MCRYHFVGDNVLCWIYQSKTVHDLIDIIRLKNGDTNFEIYPNNFEISFLKTKTERISFRKLSPTLKFSQINLVIYNIYSYFINLVSSIEYLEPEFINEVKTNIKSTYEMFFIWNFRDASDSISVLKKMCYIDLLH